MHTIPVLPELLIILAISLVIVWVFDRLRLPAIAGFLVTGVLIGPGGLGWVADEKHIELMAEIGVVLLLFTIGLEISLEQMKRMKGLVFGGGAAQLVGTGVLVAVPLGLLGVDWRMAIFIGAAAGLSSTAIVLRMFSDSGDIEAAHGRIALGVLLFQDVAVVPMMLMVPMLAGQTTAPADVAWTLGKMVVIIVGIWVVASYVFPRILERVLQARSHELFTLLAVVAALGTALLTNMAGLSLALGAFLAGLVISESPYSHQLMTEILPFRDVFNSIFFVSVGLLVKPSIFVEFPTVTIGAIVGAIILKALIVGGVALAFGYGLRVALLSGAALAQIGEFAFVLAHVGADAGLLPEPYYGIFLAVSVSTMFATPALILGSEYLVDALGWSDDRRSGAQPEHAEGHAPPEDHVIIVGYGLNGRNIARVLDTLGVGSSVIELNPAKAKRAEQEGKFTIRGDAARRLVLDHAGLSEARALVVSTADPSSNRRIVALARRLQPELTIITRTRFVGDVDMLYELGANRVVPEELETSLELVGQVMKAYGSSPNIIHREKRLLRNEGYRALRPEADIDEGLPNDSLDALLAALDFAFVRLPASAAAVGQSPRQLELRQRFDITLVAVERGGELVANPDPDFEFAAGDQLALSGTPDQLRDAVEALQKQFD